ncbi:MAG TPA: LacI family DNA-binding transcriptional regulator [Ktedonosporobacter sp.]|nr:LacI family DNA-binding transcriptional regulator [Ktedonosporobacter sp.]
MATIYDIARAAGVTPTTVSKVLAGKGSISAATRERVMQFAQDLNYQPNLVARSLIKGRTGVIGLVVHGMSNLFYAEITAIAEHLADERGMRIFVTTLSAKDEGQKLLKDLTLRRVDGMVIAAGAIAPQKLQSIPGLDLPAVYCFWEGETQDVAYPISFDFEQAGRLAAEHLLALGHRRFAIVSYTHHGRFTGFKAALADHSITLDPQCIRGGKDSPEMSKAIGLEVLTLPERPTAIFATNDMMAMGVLSAAWELGLSVPRDLSIVGHDDIEIAKYTTPPLTTLRIDTSAMLSASMDVLLAAIEGKAVTIPPIFPAHLVVRGSSGPCPEEIRR